MICTGHCYCGGVVPSLLRPLRTAYADECVLDVESLQKFFAERAGD